MSHIRNAVTYSDCETDSDHTRAYNNILCVRFEANNDSYTEHKLWLSLCERGKIYFSSQHVAFGSLEVAFYYAFRFPIAYRYT